MKSPLLGFNNNVRHKGRVFHIQTEDSGVKHPHIITHLFADGGRILKTTKRSYAEHLEDPAMAEKVRAMMQEQHKAMFVALREGAYDALIDPDKAAAAGPQSVRAATVPSTPPTVAAPPASKAPVTEVSPTAVAPAAAQAAPQAAAQAAPPAPPPAAHAPPPAPEPFHPSPPKTQRALSRPTLPVQSDVILAPPKRSSSPLGTATIAQAKDGSSVDLDALERAADAVQTPFIQQIQDLPPPPASVMARRPSGSQRAQGGYQRSITPVPGGRRATPVPQEAPGGGKYGQSRPASLFATTRPAEGMSIFGEDLISEKSLDEVILSYLAEDLESPEKK